MKWTSPIGLLGLALSSLGLVVIFGWYFHVPNIISVFPNYINMVFNTALCFTLSGMALFLSRNNSSPKNRIYTIIGFLILTISGATFAEYLFNTSLGVDEFFIKIWLFDQNQYPGRMGLNTSVGFILVSLCFILFQYTDKLFIAILTQVIIFSIMLLGISAVLGYLLKLEFLYSWYQYTRMAIHTSLGMSLLSIALWLAWVNNHNFSKFYHDSEDKKIILLSSFILISITGIACLAGFTIAGNSLENQIELIILILAISIGLGILFLYWQVLPIINQLVVVKKEAIDSSMRLQAIFNHAGEGIITIDTQGTIESFNPAATKMFGYSTKEAVGKNVEIIIPPDLREKHSAGMEEYLKTHNSTFVGKHSMVIPALRKNNEQFPMEIAITEMQVDNQYKFIGIMRDISERKAYEEKILESETRFRLAFDYSPIGVALVSLEGHWLKVNKTLCDIVGYSESEMLRMNFQTITHPDDLELDLKYVKQLYDGEIPFYQMEKRYIRKDKKITWILLIGAIIRNEQGTPLYYIGQFQDINDKKEKEKELSIKAYIDTLTGLVNRNQLENSLNLTILSALRHQQQFAVFFIDLDNFKQVNDSLGHDAGDELLKVISDRFRNSIRKTDIAARLGGDEFILVLHDIKSPEIAAVFAENILNILIKPITIKEHELLVTASIGISFYPADGEDYHSLINSADLALYKAKEEGRNNYQFCTKKINEEIKNKLLFKNALKNALKNNEFYLTYLPKINIQKKITGFETLLRWENKEYQTVSPSKIIPLAEEIGIINQIDDWIYDTAIDQGSHLRTSCHLPIKISVNVSTKQYLQPEFSSSVLNKLNQKQSPAQFLEVEIHESLIMQNPNHSIKVIKHLKDNGIGIIIDNFGTGYSSLNYLNQFNADYIKIDPQFIKHIVENFEHQGLVMAIIALARSLNIKVIAAGVESMDQYHLLSQLGCDELQGYYISKPLLAKEISQFIQQYSNKVSG